MRRARACRFLQNSLFSKSKTTNFSPRRGPRAVSHTPLGRPWGRVGLLELPKEAFRASKQTFGRPRECQNDRNLSHFAFSWEGFKGRVAFNTVCPSGRAAPLSLDSKLQIELNESGAPARLCFVAGNDCHMLAPCGRVGRVAPQSIWYIYIYILQ